MLNQFAKIRFDNREFIFLAAYRWASLIPAVVGNARK